MNMLLASRSMLSTACLHVQTTAMARQASIFGIEDHIPDLETCSFPDAVEVVKVAAVLTCMLEARHVPM